ncbi:Bax inhibitor 1 [Datura stramonium]|uniref:Bax inhibitor 1 n=1 Tax=Datura stramonium TaxID=4076 RepID=A0ABS8RHF9_DATST|nr:Bax inhibitor 1 [Datura stramonium]
MKMNTYFKRSWRKADMMNFGVIPEPAHTILKRVYLTLFCAMLSSTIGSYLHLFWEARGLLALLSSIANLLWLYFTSPRRVVYLALFFIMLSSTFGSYLHLFWEVGGLFTVLSSVASLLWLYFTSARGVKKRDSLLMIAAFSLGASVDLLTEYPFEIDQTLVASLLASTTVGIGTFCFVVNAFDILDSHTSHGMLKVSVVLTLFMGYFVVYSQEILYDARFGNINSINRTITVLFRLPAIVVHSARLCLGMNAVKAYFNRNWKRTDMMNSGGFPQHAHTSLKRVYLTLFCAMLNATFGSYLHLIYEVGGLFTVLLSVASLLWLYFTSPWRERKRVSILMVAAFFIGASVGLFTKYLFEINQGFVVTLLAGTTIIFGSFWLGAKTNSERRDIYISAVFESWILVYMWFDGYCDIIESHTAHSMLKVYAVLVLFTGYLVLYSQEILYDARYGDVNFVNCTFTVFFCLPAIVIHAARLYLGATIQQHRQIHLE